MILDLEKLSGKFSLKALSTQKKYVVDRSIISKVGQIYTKETATLDLKRLMQLGIFTSVRFDTDRKDDGIALVCTVTDLTFTLCILIANN